MPELIEVGNIVIAGASSLDDAQTKERGVPGRTDTERSNVVEGAGAVTADDLSDDVDADGKDGLVGPAIFTATTPTIPEDMEEVDIGFEEGVIGTAVDLASPKLHDETSEASDARKDTSQGEGSPISTSPASDSLSAGRAGNSRPETPPAGHGPPKPRISITPQPLSPSRYRPYGLRQSSAFGSTSESLHEPDSTPPSASSSRPSFHSDADTSPVTPSHRHHSPPGSSSEPSPIGDGVDASSSNKSSTDPSPRLKEWEATNGSNPNPNTPRLLSGSLDSSTSPAFKSISPRSPQLAQTFRSPPNSPHSGQTSFSNTPRLHLCTPSFSTFSPGDIAPRSLPFKPALPKASLAFNGQANGKEGAAPFESIDLETNPPVAPEAIPHSTAMGRFDASANGLIAADGDDRENSEDAKQVKRRSWGGFATKKTPDGAGQNLAAPPDLDQDRRHSSADDKLSPPHISTKCASIGNQHDSQNAEAGPSTPPRRHAPPAHPHPYPIPTSPIRTDRHDSLSVQSDRAASLPSSKAPQSSQTNGAPLHGLGVKGISTFEKVISHTRPSWLPPKDKGEDEAHYRQWEEVMAQAKEVEVARRKIQDARRLDREKKLALSVPRWEALLGSGPGGSATPTAGRDHLSALTMSRRGSGSANGTGASTPNGVSEGFSVSKVKSDLGLRRLWFEGVPSHLRGKAWHLAIGNPLALSKDAYKTYLKRSQRSLDSGRFPPSVLEQLDRDLDVTLPHLRLFVADSPMRAELREFVCAWIVYRSDEGNGYAPYITHLSAMFLLTSPPALAFHSLVNLLSRPCLLAFFTQTTDEIDAFYRVFENLQADKFPKIFANCKNLGLKLPESYFRSLFIEQVPFEACCRLWDQIVLDGDGYIFRAALSIFGFLEPRLHFPDKEEIQSVLEGRNEATLAITERERERARLRGETWDDTVDGSLSVFGLNEDALFDWLESDEWRESRFERLVSREMPD